VSDDVIRLVTATDLAATEQAEYEDAAHSEAVSMLERALALVKERKTSAVAIALAFDDGGYGHLLPIAGNRIGHLVGAIADMEFTLLRKTNE
jgi:hypothetical protein